MGDATVRRLPGIEWGIVSQAFPGETECGDRHLVAGFPNGALVAVIDGLGHGEEAAAGDTLIFATDGISSEFARGIPWGLSPQEIANSVCARHFKGTDDALVLVARYRGGVRGEDGA